MRLPITGEGLGLEVLAAERENGREGAERRRRSWRRRTARKNHVRRWWKERCGLRELKYECLRFKISGDLGLE